MIYIYTSSESCFVFVAIFTWAPKCLELQMPGVHRQQRKITNYRDLHLELSKIYLQNLFLSKKYRTTVKS